MSIQKFLKYSDKCSFPKLPHKKPAEAGFYVICGLTITRYQNRPDLRSAVLPGWQMRLLQSPAVQPELHPQHGDAYDPGGTRNRYLPGSDDPQ